MEKFELRRYSAMEQLASAAARDWLNLLVEIRSQQPAICVALAGGRIAEVFFREAANQLRTSHGSLDGVHFFWSDERCVPPDDPQSNFRLANEALLKPLGVPLAQVHRIEGERAPQAACSAAETEIRRRATSLSGSQPVLDLVFLGMGEDGHVASLFPGEPASAMSDPAIVRSVRATKPPPQRITFGYPLIAAARRVWVLASGAGKEQAFRASLIPGGDTPLARVLRLRETTRIYSDLAK